VKPTASDVDRLMRDDTFKAIIEQVKNDQINIFINSARHGTQEREDAHAMFQAVVKIEQALKSVITEEAIKQKREEGRSK